MEVVVGLVVVVLSIIAAALKIQFKSGKNAGRAEQIQDDIDLAKKASQARDAALRDSDKRQQLRDKYRRQ